MFTIISHIWNDFFPFWLKFTVYILFGCYSLTYFDTRWKKDGNVWPWFQKLKLWSKIVKPYFQASIVLEEKLNPKQLYIFCKFPHGATSVAHLLTMTDACGMISEVYPSPKRDLAASVLFFIPILKDILLWWGCVDASSFTAKYNIQKGRSLLIYIGGEKEQLLTKPYENKVVLKSRKGFLKLALQYGAHLVPMYAYGENEAYHVSNFLLGFRIWLQKNFQIGIPIIWGRYGTFLPFPVNLCIEIGKPVPVEKVKDGEEATSEAIDKLQKVFESELIRLFDRTKQSHGYGSDIQLQII